MFWFVFVSVYNVLCHSTHLVTGRCVISIGTVSVSGSEESLLKSLEEHDNRMENLIKNMCSAFETAENRSIAGGQEKYFQDLKTLYYNMSVNLDRVRENFPKTLESQAIQEQEEYLRSLNLNLTSVIVKADERIQSVNEKLAFIYESLFSALQTVNKTLDDKVQEMQEQFSSLLIGNVVGALREHDQKLQAINETLSSAIDEINEKLNAKLNNSVLNHVNESFRDIRTQDHCRNTSILCDCSDIKANGYTTSGVYRIYVVYEGQRYYANASCDMTTTNGDWTVFQRRKDGSVDFYRGWNDYENGFGNPNGEFWLGNNFLHLLASKRRYRLRIDLEDFEGEKRYAEYSTFNISSSADKYRLRIGTYSGTAGDSLSFSNGQRFTTKDNDNDAHTSINCAVYQRSGWWHRDCSAANLNGLYLRGRYSSNDSLESELGIQWRAWHGQWYSLKTSEMKIAS